MGNKKTIPSQSTINSAGGPGLHLMNAVALSSTNTVTSSVFNASYLDNLGLQVMFVGTMTGTLSVECSIDNVNFIALTFDPTLTQPSGSDLSYLVNLNQLPYPYLKISYTNETGSGTLDVYLSGKDLN